MNVNDALLALNTITPGAWVTYYTGHLGEDARSIGIEDWRLVAKRAYELYLQGRITLVHRRINRAKSVFGCGAFDYIAVGLAPPFVEVIEKNGSEHGNGPVLSANKSRMCEKRQHLAAHPRKIAASTSQQHQEAGGDHRNARLAAGVAVGCPE